jgi:hypothetical protein
MSKDCYLRPEEYDERHSQITEEIDRTNTQKRRRSGTCSHRLINTSFINI